jgi:hypothetical protein
MDFFIGPRGGYFMDPLRLGLIEDRYQNNVHNPVKNYHVIAKLG